MLRPHRQASILVRVVFLLSLYLGLTVVAVTSGVVFLRGSGPDSKLAALADPYSFNFTAWEARHFPGKLLYDLGHLWDSRRSVREEEQLLERYFTLAAEITALESAPQDGDTTKLLLLKERERRSMENEVEDIIERRISGLLGEQGLTFTPPLFADFDFVFPLVDFELDRPPKILVISPRERIDLTASFRLDGALDDATIATLERQAEANDVSALVINVGGVATYPSALSEHLSYESLVRTAIHEWLHQYLALHPLGRNYFGSSESRTLNETVANLAGDELAALFFQKYPRSLDSHDPARNEYVSGEIRNLRLEVERLLMAGQVRAAESLMEEKRLQLQASGIYIRRLNQAYFAFYGFYGDTGASISPIGPRLAELRARSGSVTDFVRTAAGIISIEDLDGLLAN